MSVQNYLKLLQGFVLVFVGLFYTELAAQSVDSGTSTTEETQVLLDIMDESLQSMAAEDYRLRRVGGYALLGTGGVMGVGGLVTLAVGDSDVSGLLGYSLVGTGAILGGLSFIPLKRLSETERMYAEFNEKPADTPEQMQQKYIYWDSRFHEYAKEERRERILFGIVGISIGLAWGSAASTAEDPSQASYGAAALPLIISGVMGLVVKSKAEKRYAIYERSKGGILGTYSAVQVSYGIAPNADGQLMGVLQVRF